MSEAGMNDTMQHDPVAIQDEIISSMSCLSQDDDRTNTGLGWPVRAMNEMPGAVSDEDVRGLRIAA